jgi:hypothetical protein
MTKNPKTRNNFYCCAEFDGNCVVLSGVDGLNDIPCPFQHIAHAINDSCLIDSFQEGELFFYELIEYKSNKKVPENHKEVERGIGSFSNDDKYTLNRITILSSIDGPTSSPSEFTINKKLFLQTYVPKDYRELFAIPNTIIASEVSGCPSPVELQNNTLLGRLNGTIQSIDKSELVAILGDDSASQLISSDENNLISPSSKFSLTGEDSIITANSIKLNPVSRRPLKKVKGQMIYNDKLGAFEFWNGKQWRTIISQ